MDFNLYFRVGQDEPMTSLKNRPSYRSSQLEALKVDMQKHWLIENFLRKKGSPVWEAEEIHPVPQEDFGNERLLNFPLFGKDTIR